MMMMKKRMQLPSYVLGSLDSLRIVVVGPLGPTVLSRQTPKQNERRI